MTYETIDHNGQTFVQIPIEEFNQLMATAEDAEDVAAIKAEQASDEERFPLEMVERILLHNESPITVYREYRNMTKTALGNIVGVSAQHIGMLERKERAGTIDIYADLAHALDVPIDFLIAQRT